MSDRTISSDLKPWKHPQRGTWYARGSVPARRPDGSIARTRITRGPGRRTKAEAQELADNLNKHYVSQAIAVKKSLTFSAAFLNYMTGGERDGRFFEEILLEIGSMECGLIDDNMVSEVARKLYPDRAASTINRQVYTPIIAVLAQAAKSGACSKPNFTRPKGHDAVGKAKPPPDEWYEKVLPLCLPHIAACLTLMWLTGMRTKEALSIAPDDVKGDHVQIESKDGNTYLVPLPDVTIALLQQYDWRNTKWIFKYSYTSRSSFNRYVATVSKRAGVDPYPPHSVGRHRFATDGLKSGLSVLHVAKGGRWSDPKMVMRRYGHLAQNEVAEDMRLLGNQRVTGMSLKLGKPDELIDI